jgi:hypothetical protein
VAFEQEMADQQIKQMLLAYTILVLKEGRPLLVDDLDEACEDMLVKDFSHKIDFQVRAIHGNALSYRLREQTGTWQTGS